MRDINKSKILNLVRVKGPISRVEIAKALNLSQATITYISEELISSGYVIEGGEQKSTGGRKAKLLRLNDDIGVIASVGISKNGLEVVLCDLRNKPLDHAFTEQAVGTGEQTAKAIAVALQHLLEQNSQPKLLGIAVISSGLVDRDSGTIVKSTLLDWQDVPIRDLLQPYFPEVKILVDKDINAVAMYEMSFGEAKSLQDFLVVSVGEGLGLSVVINNHIYYGDYGGAGEFGHTVINVDGYACHCGQHGCLEQYASEFYLKNRVMELGTTQYGEHHLLRHIGKAAQQGDQLAVDMLKQMGVYLGYGVRNLINIFNPKAIVLVGAAVEYQSIFIDDMWHTAKHNFFANVDLPTKVLTSAVDNDAWYQGASILISNSLFETPIYQEVSGFGGLN